MYWSRTNSLVDVALYLLLSGVWAVGGWLLVSHAFRLRYIERMVSGLAAGFLLFIGLGNLYAHFLSLPIAFWGAAFSILVAGIIYTWRSNHKPWLAIRDLTAFPLLIALSVLTALFTLILRGQAIFDEYLHLPLISIMAAGDIPPHFYLNPGFYFAYHYGIQVYAASLVRLGDFFPWSAWDTSRALAIAFTLVLGWIWVRRLTRSQLAAWLGSILFTFGGGTRWLLLLLPPSWLVWVSQAVHLVGTGLDTAPTLAQALYKPWLIDGGGPVPYPFAFHDGIFVPVFFTLGSTGAMPFMTILLLLLLIPRSRFTRAGLVIWTILFATLALSAEHLFVVIWVGVALTLVLVLILNKRVFRPLSQGVLSQWGIILALSALFSLLQGGFITETARNLLASLSGTSIQSYNARGFSIRWPPGLYSAHLGNLSIFNPGQLVALLAELGPAILLIPVIFIRFKKQLKDKDWFTTGLALSVVISLILPLFFQYEVDRSSTRLPATALWTCLVLGFPILWVTLPKLKLAVRLGAIILFIVLLVGGAVIFTTQLHSIGKSEYSYYIDRLDVEYSAEYWNKLPKAAQVLDEIPERSVTLFGRISLANSGIYTPLPAFQALIADPDPAKIAQAGYDYVYMDNTWWESLSASQQAGFQQPCIDVIDERRQPGSGNYRLLVDVSACR